ncbi:hypothetical protein ACUNV4_27735 [Granulosicoccus sp. 3-233]|uniref:hypothetical protein n=1 Tax=Granulosicoccus sp. 3-233 TaxID=3417969 RepID=UPI003D33AC34
MDASNLTALWWAVALSGVYHGINPGMGWPLAVSAGLMQGNRRSLVMALGMLALGHLLAMLVILLPFSVMSSLVVWETELRMGAGILVMLMGLYLLVNRRHPRFLARVPPTRLALWSFLAAMAHGAGLMLVPIYLSICGVDMGDAGHQAAQLLLGRNLASALSVAFVHTMAMTLAGGFIAALIYFWLGLRFLSRTWFNLDVVWALSLILVGALGIYGARFPH